MLGVALAHLPRRGLECLAAVLAAVFFCFLRVAGRLRRPQHRAAALFRTAATGVDHIDIGRIVALAADLVVVVEFLSDFDGPDGIDEHSAILDVRFAVRITAVIDEARVVAIHRGIDDDIAIHREQEGVIVILVMIIVATIGARMGDAVPPRTR